MPEANQEAPITAGPTGADKVKADTMAALAARAQDPVKIVEKDRKLQLPPHRMQGREYSNQDHVVTVEAGWTMDDVMKPIFWGSLWQKLRRYDKVAICVDDGSWYAEVLVVQCGTGFAFVRPTLYIDFSKDDPLPKDGDEFEIRELGPVRKWCVVRKADNQVMKEKCESKRDASHWLDDYLVKQAKSTALI